MAFGLQGRSNHEVKRHSYLIVALLVALLPLAVDIDLLGDRAVRLLRHPGPVTLSTHILALILQAITDVGIHPKSVSFSVHIRPFEYGLEAAGRV